MEGTKVLNGATIEDVVLETDEEVAHREYCAYRLTIKTSKGTLVFAGCHDSIGSLIVDGKDVGEFPEIKQEVPQ